jgi:hypothetical protein
MYPMRAMHGTANLLTSYSRRSTATVLALKFVCIVSVLSGKQNDLYADS